jgi:hypothetical protein
MEKQAYSRKDPSRWPRDTFYPLEKVFVDRRRSLGRYNSLVDSGHIIFVCVS